MDYTSSRQNELPGIRVEDTSRPLTRSYTLYGESTSSGLPDISAYDNTPLPNLLRITKVDTSDGGYYWPYNLLRHVLTRERILVQLKTYTGLENAEVYLNHIRPEYDDGLGRTPTYLIIFTLLLLCDRGHKISDFVRDQVSDRNLPVCEYEENGDSELCLHDRPDRPLECFQKPGWGTPERESFERNQWHLLIPYLKFERGIARFDQFHDKMVLPWLKADVRSRSSINPSEEVGAFASVCCVKIHPASHDFHDVLRQMHLTDERFALKTLHDHSVNDEAQFQNERRQLSNFNGLVHQHLPVLLTTFLYRGKYHFLFPYANGTLEQYFEDQSHPRSLELSTIRWFSKQCSGIMAAINIIHEPNHLNVSKYGRHGDIKPDNILWFRSSDDHRGIFVISDLGLSSLNSNISRSNIPNSRLKGKPPSYRPPECDLKGGTISRAFDIWTLGCLFLELVTWLLGGKDLLKTFQEERLTEYYLTGSKNDIFFRIFKEKDSFVVQVKPQVTKWFDKLHSHENCTNFVHEILEVVEKDMIVVISKGKTRASSKSLHAKLEKIHAKCMDDSNTDYCLMKTPRPLPTPSRAATLVEANLAKAAQQEIAEHRPDLPIHDLSHGEIKKSLRPDQFENIDLYWGAIHEEPEQE